MTVEHRRRWVVWLALGLLLTGVFMTTDSIAGLRFRPVYLGVLGLGCATLWMVAAPAIWSCAGRFPLGGSHLLGHVALHLVLGVAFSFGLTSVFATGMWGAYELSYDDTYSFEDAFQDAVSYFLLAKILFYALVVVARGAHDQAARTARVQAELSSARLDTLRMQMNPHFLFNALNSVSGLVRTHESEKALRMVARIGDVLRRSLTEERRPEASLEEELDALDEILDIERCRFGERLIVRTEVDEALLEVRIPRLILQPLVENAIRHGIEAVPEAGEIVLRARREAGAIVLEVEDNGPGPGKAPVEGIGLGNTRSRLKTLFGERATMVVSAAPDRGTRVTIRLPLPGREGA